MCNSEKGSASLKCLLYTADSVSMYELYNLWGYDATICAPLVARAGIMSHLCSLAAKVRVTLVLWVLVV